MKDVYKILIAILLAVPIMGVGIAFAQKLDTTKITKDSIFELQAEEKYSNTEKAYNILPEEEIIKLKEEYANTQEIVTALNKIEYRLIRIEKKL